MQFAWFRISVFPSFANNLCRVDGTGDQNVDTSWQGTREWEMGKSFAAKMLLVATVLTTSVYEIGATTVGNTLRIVIN